MAKQHTYQITTQWTGNSGTGTSSYRAYERDHVIQSENKPQIPGSSDPSFRGDKTRYNPEELLVSALSSCHMLWYLHLCSEAGIIVLDYVDKATGTMVETADGGGYFSEVTLHPAVLVAESAMIDKSTSLHQQATKLCFIANSCKFPVNHQPSTVALKE